MTIHDGHIVTANDGRRALRTQLFESRQSMSADFKKEKDAQLRESIWVFLNGLSKMPGRIALYWPIRGEPDLIPLTERLWQTGCELFLPVVIESQAPLAFVPFTAETTFRAGAYNIPEPEKKGGGIIFPDVALIPCLGYTNTRHRLGYGGGFYDRTLGLWRSHGHEVLSVGVAYEDALVNFEPSAHDLPLSCVLTT